MEQGEYWDNNQEQVFAEDVPNNSGDRPSVFVNGSYVNVDVGSSFIETCKSVAKNAGLGKFRVFLNGDEMQPSDAPDVINSSDRVELQKYDVAG